MTVFYLLIGVVVVLFALGSLSKLKLRRVLVFEYQQGALFTNGAFRKILGPGRHWSSATRVISVVDTRLQTISIAGQEVLTTDGLSLKITLAGEYRVSDAGRYLLTSFSPATSLYQDAQQALREAVGSISFESILETRAAINTRMLELLAPKAERLGLEVTSLEIRDIILPGELRKAYAQAVTAQKEGLAALERARGEAAALRSLANAAKLMQEHPGLLQLRAVQAIEASTGNTLTLELAGSIEKPQP